MASRDPQPSATPNPDGNLSARVASVTDVGQKRGHNEDNYLILPLSGNATPQSGELNTLSLKGPGMLIAVADGMGGHHGGEVASRLCVENLAKEIVPRLRDSAPGYADLPAAFEQAVVATHHAIIAYAQEHAENRTMGTTLTAVIARGNHAQVAQVGDSRAYLFRAGNLVLLTQDQTIGNRLRERGTDPDMINPQFKELLTQAMGAQRELSVVMTSTDLEPQDLLLLCSDGLYKVVTPEEVVDILELEIPLIERARKMIARGNENGGPDNITVILAEILPAAAAG